MSNAETTVCVTGASGFVGSRIVADLLDRGYTVRGTVRNPDDTEKYGFLMKLPGATDRLTLHQGQLLEDGSFDDAMAGCRWAIHTASPYALDVEDPQRDLVDPAVKGTLNVLRSALGGGVDKVVVTSSMAAITDEPESDHVLTEEDWNEKSTLQRNPYYLSKTEAEKAAWKFHGEHPELDVVVINPFLIIGPSLTPSLNESNKVFVDLLGGEYPGVMSITWGMVDVRDVSEAHVRAMENPEATGRYICVEHCVEMSDVVKLLEEAGYGEGRKLPRFDMACSVGDYAVKLLSYFQPRGVGTYLRTHIGRVPRFSSAKIQESLGMAFRPVETSIRDTVDDLIRWGHVPDVET
jgi:dihydroflavonol-4-reductase